MHILEGTIKTLRGELLEGVERSAKYADIRIYIYICVYVHICRYIYI